MARTYNAGSQLPSPDLWNIALNSRATLEEVDQTSGACRNNELSSQPSINAVSQYLGPAFEPSHPLALYPTPRVGGCQQTNAGDRVPYDIISSNEHHLTTGPSQGYNQFNSRPLIPNWLYDYEEFSREYHHPIDEADITAMVPPDLLNGLDVINHADGSFFARNTLDGMGSHIDSSWSADVFGDDTFVDFYETNSVFFPVDYVNHSTPDPPSNSGLELSPASSSRTRFACHHPQCGHRTFSRRADRDRHTRKHDNVRPYVCPKADCMKKFYRRDKLQSHLERGH